jgi:hypothetical protein
MENNESICQRKLAGMFLNQIIQAVQSGKFRGIQHRLETLFMEIMKKDHVSKGKQGVTGAYRKRMIEAPKTWMANDLKNFHLFKLD